MLKFIKHHLDTIAGVEIYPIISLVLFFIVFITMLIIVLKLPKKSIDEVSNLPLDND
jgi:cbb3-type cytochrome oxidase subunit 3